MQLQNDGLILDPIEAERVLDALGDFVTDSTKVIKRAGDLDVQLSDANMQPQAVGSKIGALVERVQIAEGLLERGSLGDALPVTFDEGPVVVAALDAVFRSLQPTLRQHEAERRSHREAREALACIPGRSMLSGTVYARSHTPAPPSRDEIYHQEEIGRIHDLNRLTTSVHNAVARRSGSRS